MAALSGIKKRIRVIDVTAKITNAMLLVATAKLKRSRNLLTGTRGFSNGVYGVAKSILSQAKSLDFLKVPEHRTKNS